MLPFAPPHYIVGEFDEQIEGGETLYSDEGLDYCKSCAEELLDRVLPFLPEDQREEHMVCESYPIGFDAAICSRCYAPLDCTLSEYGIAEELRHFRKHPLKAPLDPVAAFEIARVLESDSNNPEIVRLAQRAAELIPDLPQGEARDEDLEAAEA